LVLAQLKRYLAGEDMQVKCFVARCTRNDVL